MSWSTIHGQEYAVSVLRSHLASGRVPPAYLFIGPEGVGKRMAAMTWARALNCEHGAAQVCAGTPCRSCKKIESGAHPDVHVLEPEGASASIRIDAVQTLLEQVALSPFFGRSHVVVIDGADRLTDDAANCLLKTLEEPTARTRFALLTSQPTRCLPTIVSRCQQIRFHPRATPVVRDEAMHTQFNQTQARGWLAWTPPTDRDELSHWLTASIQWLRDAAVSSVTQQRPARFDLDRSISAAMRMMELEESLREQSISARLIGALFKEEWLALIQ